MNVIKLAWKNIIFRPLQSSLSVLLLALGVGLVVILLLLQGQLNQNFDRNLAGVDLILGAKGSPLQMVMSSMYQLDAPTGNLTINEVKPFLNPRHPLIEESIPLSMGDNFRGFRIVGATPNLINWYGGELAEGELYTRDGEGIMGAEVASVHNMSVGDSFKGDHGINADDPLHEQHAHDFVVSGILKPTGTVLDRLVLVTNQAYWKMHGEGHEDHDHEDHSHDDHEAHSDEDHDHDHDDHDHEGHNHDDHAAHNGDDHDHDYEGHDHEGHNHDDHAAHNGDDHDHDHEGHDHEGHQHDHDHHAHESSPTSGSPNQDHHEHADHHDHGTHEHEAGGGRVLTAADLLEEDGEKELTSVLIRYKNDKDFQSLQMGRMINENTDIMAVDPAYQISKVRYQFGQGERVLRILAVVIMIVSALSVFISLFNSLRERRYELALMRGMGAGQGTIFGLIVAEGLLLGLLGYVVGIALGHGVMEILSTRLEDNYGFRFEGTQWMVEEWWLLLGALGIGLIAAVLPASQAANTDIADTLT